MPILGESPLDWKDGTYRYGPGLTLALARKMLEAGENEAVKQGVPMAMAVSDNGGNLVAFSRMDNTALFAIQIAMDKAYTAVFSKLPTGKLGAAYHTGQLIPLFFHERWITFQGGYPLIKNGVIMGGLGISGGMIEDIYVAKVMLKTGGFEYADADNYLKEYQKEMKKEKQTLKAAKKPS
jgi:uncharacterized protein GlcG (DUF336 family)